MLIYDSCVCNKHCPYTWKNKMWLIYGYSYLMQCLTLHPTYSGGGEEELTLFKLAIHCILLERDYIFKIQTHTSGTTERCLEGSVCH